MTKQGKHAKHNKRKAASIKQAKAPLKRKGANVERDTDVFKRRKFIKNNHVEAPVDVVEEEDTSEEEVEDTEYNKLLQVFGKSSDKNTAIGSEDEEEDEDDEDDEDVGNNDKEDIAESEDDSDDGIEEEELENNLEDDDGGENSDAQEEEDESEEDSDDEAVENEDVENEDSLDPFCLHVDTELSSSMVKVLTEKSRWSNTSLVYPQLGNLQVHNLNCSKEQLPSTTSLDSVAPSKHNQIGAEPKIKTLTGLSLKQKLSVNTPDNLTDKQMELLSLMSSYRDLCYTERTYEQAEQLRLTYCIHAVNHVLKTRTRILNNNAKHEARATNEEKLRDQGFTRPKVLIIVPFKEAARRVVECIISLLFPHDKGNVANRKRFNQDYAKVVTARKDKPEDYYNTFEGDIDDSFKLGLGVTKNTLKLYSDFYNSDIIISSPLGLRLVTGVEEDGKEGGEGDTDFLSSIELLIMDQTDVFLMQNWDHVSTVLAQLHLQPKDSHGTDFNRVRLWTLDGHARYYRQTLIFSGLPFPELNSVWNNTCVNYKGKVRVANPVPGTGALARVLSDTPLVWHRIDAESISDSLEKRFKYFTEKIMPQFSRDNMDHTLIFIPSYFDFVKVRNWSKFSDLDFSEISEYSKDKRVAKARDEFYHNEKHFLLYTERAHFYRRFRIKGIRHLIFFQPPTYPGVLAELCNLQQSAFQNPRGGSDSNMSCTVLYTKYDATRVSQCVGSTTASTMLRAESAVHRFQP